MYSDQPCNIRNKFQSTIFVLLTYDIVKNYSIFNQVRLSEQVTLSTGAISLSSSYNKISNNKSKKAVFSI